jgi:4-hydroxy-tetrahydrodipicolinate synthase
MAVKFRGALTALITPFKNGAFDRDAMANLIEQQLAAGIDGLVPCATTGEGPTLTLDEHRSIMRFVVERVHGRVPVIGGAGSNNTRHAIELQKMVKEAGADGALQVTPYYNKPNQRGLIAHFRAIVDACPLPTLLYNVPGRTGCDLQPKSVSELAKHPSIVGIKEATGLAARAQEIINLVPPDFAVLSGEDAVILPLLAIGGHGVISVVSHVAPAAVVGLCDAAQKNDSAAAQRYSRQLAPLARLLFFDTNPIPVKTACAALGLCCEEFRLPLVPMEAEERAKFVADLKAIGVEGLR